MESEDEQEPEKTVVAVAELAKMKGPISCKALLKAPNDQKPPPLTGGLFQTNSQQTRFIPLIYQSYMFCLTK